jgi:quercetin dioxygenase-like cupin family protein
MEHVELIAREGSPLAYIVHATLDPSQTTFITPPEYNHQLGFVVYPAGGRIAPHTHRPIERHIRGTSEILIVRKGRCEVDLYSEDHILVATRELVCGDILLLISGGHGFRMLEDTVLLEVKQGPYTGLEEKERF